MNTTDPASPLRAAAEAIRTAGLHDSPMRLAKAALTAAGFAEAERRLRAVRSLVDAAARDAATFGRGGPGCVSVTALRAALAGTDRAPESDYTEHLISMAGGDGDDEGACDSDVTLQALEDAGVDKAGQFDALVAAQQLAVTVWNDECPCGHTWDEHKFDVGCIAGWEFEGPDPGVASQEGCNCQLVHTEKSL